jgi:hypothetical protein
VLPVDPEKVLNDQWQHVRAKLHKTAIQALVAAGQDLLAYNACLGYSAAAMADVVERNSRCHR